jgi:hypothetical protein
VSREIDFLTHHGGMMSLLQDKEISSIIGNFKKLNKAILTLHFVHGPKSIILSFIFTYVNTTIIIHQLLRLITILNLGHPSRIPLAELTLISV